MKKTTVICGIVFFMLLVSLGIYGVTKKEQTTSQVQGVQMEKEISYSNLADEKTKNQLKSLLEETGVANDDIDTFFAWVEDFNSRVGAVNAFHNGFTALEKYKQVDYNDVFLDIRYLENGDMQMDPNCRLTAFLLYRNFIEIGKAEEEASNFLMFDEEAIENDPVFLPIKNELEKFVTVFNPVNVKNMSTLEEHIEAIKAEWEERGLVFGGDDRVEMVNLLIHDVFDDVRFVGHSGLLFHTEDGLYLLEKYSSGMPYQFTRFEKEQEVADYLLSRTDIYGDGKELRPIVMINYEAIG